MIYVVIVGFAGALLMFAGDMLLYYTPEDFAYDSKSSSAEKIQAIVDVMKKLPAKRVMAVGIFCAVLKGAVASCGIYQ